MADLTLALAGHAPNNWNNVDFLLHETLKLGAPDGQGYYARPDRYSSITVYALLTEGTVPPGLRHALDILPYIVGARFEIFTEKATGDILKWDADAVHESADPYESLISALGEARSARLLINWQTDDADDERLIRLAHEQGKIRVFDLVEGLVEITPDDPEPETPQAVPVEPEETPPKRRRREELEDPREALEDTPATLVSAPPVVEEAAPFAPAQTTIPVEDQYAITRALAEQVYGALVVAADYHNYSDCQDAIRAGKAVAPVERSPLTQELTNVAEMLRAVIYGEVPYGETGPAVAPRTRTGRTAGPVKVIWNDSTREWQKAGRGRVRSGVRTGLMDADGKVTESAA